MRTFLNFMLGMLLCAVAIILFFVNTDLTDVLSILCFCVGFARAVTPDQHKRKVRRKF